MNQEIFSGHRFSRDLSTYVNGGSFSRKDFLISILSQANPFNRYAGIICRQYMKRRDSLPDGISPVFDIKIEVYKGRNSSVHRMMEYLSAVKNDLVGAYVHGSLGTYEEVAFSDFDALVILGDEVFKAPDRLAEVARKINEARGIMFDFDPLQHHGWFVLTESDLNFYPEYYFPVELFRHAKSLFPDKGFTLNIRVQDSSDKIHQAFHDLSHGVKGLLTKRRFPKDMYQLKILLSQFMLLPSMHVQLRDQKGIFKKFSFEAAGVDFSDGDWSIMTEVSSLRKNWYYRISSSRRLLITKPTAISRFLARRWAPSIPGGMKKVLTDDFYQRMLVLVTRMRRNLQ
jgi:predicted nucleotidyltransferase